MRIRGRRRGAGGEGRVKWAPNEKEAINQSLMVMYYTCQGQCVKSTTTILWFKWRNQIGANRKKALIIWEWQTCREVWSRCRQRPKLRLNSIKCQGSELQMIAGNNALVKSRGKSGVSVKKVGFASLRPLSGKVTTDLSEKAGRSTPLHRGDILITMRAASELKSGHIGNVHKSELKRSPTRGS
jgi:hypothetical protein